MKIHVVSRGETLSAIAKQYGMKSWQELYNHPSNESFRRKRPNPNRIYPGDRINIPISNVKFTHKVTLHFRSISLTNVPFNNLFKNAQRVYSPYGINIQFGSGESLHLSEAEAKRFEKIDGQCKWKITTGEFAQLQKTGSPSPWLGIRVYFVNKFGSRLLGCGGHIPGKPACICASTGSKWTMAHEVGHVLLGSSFTPVHSTDTKNLMLSGTPNITAKLPILTTKQVEQVKKSPYCIPV